MDIRHLRRAVVLARFLNFTRAARDLHITQSALSRSIKALETECRLQLFDRTQGGVALTQAGREFIRHAKALLRNEAALRNVVDQVAQGEGGCISLGVTPLAARILLAPVLSKRVNQAHFHAEVFIGTSKQILPRVMNEEIDLGICVGELAAGNTPFSALTLAQLPVAVIVRKDHPLTRTKSFCADDMDRYPLVRSTPYNSDDILPIVVGLARSDPPAITVEDFEVLDQVVSTSDAVWVTSPVAARQGILDGRLTQLPLSWLPNKTISLVAYSLSQRTLSPIARAMLQNFKAIGATLAST